MIRACIRMFGVAWAVAVFLCGTSQAETPTVRSYLHKTVLLRGLVAGTTLEFDAKGRLTGGDARRVSFTLACLYIEHISRKGDTLTLTGRRIGLYNRDDDGAHFASVPLVLAAAFINGTFHVRRPLEERIEVTVPGAADEEDFAPALARIFASSWHEVAYALPGMWRLLTHQERTDSLTNAAGPQPHSQDPEIVERVHPELTEEAAAVAAGGTCQVRALVSTDGAVQEVRIVKPIGLGMDERAAEAVSRYRFSPAVKNGKSVAMAMTVTVRFEPE